MESPLYLRECERIQRELLRPVGQSKKHSWYEAWVNVFVGVTVAMVGNWIILPVVLGVPMHIVDNVLITAFFTGVSLVRSYALRRLFNWMHLKGGA